MLLDHGCFDAEVLSILTGCALQTPIGPKTLAEAYLARKQRWPIPLPREFIEFANYGTYDFDEIHDEATIASLLASAGLSNDTGCPGIHLVKWDLVRLNGSRCGTHGGDVVFNRRKLEDVPGFIQNLDRYWVDWVCVPLICLGLLIVV